MLQPAKPNADPGTRAGPSFERFFEVEYPRLARALLLLTGDPREAEDLAQEALARAFERWARVGGAGGSFMDVDLGPGLGG